MATLPETNEYPEGIYQIETTDPVLGGAPVFATKAGLVNIPFWQLAQRTRWLKTRVDQLLGQVVAATTSVTGIVRLSSATNSTSATLAATPAAVKAVMDSVETRARTDTTITGAGLVTGGGSLGQHRILTVAEATLTEAVQGLSDSVAMTPRRTKSAIDAALPASLRKDAAPTDDWNNAVESGFYRSSSALNQPPSSVANWLGEVVCYNSNHIRQTAWTISTSGDTDTVTWQRQRRAGVWSQWYRLRQSEDEIAAMHGGNIASTGWQRLPSGLILQWGEAAVSNGGSVTLPTAFPTACATVVLSDGTDNAASDKGHLIALAEKSRTAFKVAVLRSDGAAGQSKFSFFAIGW